VDLYNYVTGSLIRNMSNSSVSMGLNYSHRDKILAGGGIRFHIFDLGTYLKQQKGSTAANHVSFNPRANQAVVNSTGTTATIWDMNTRTLIRTLSGHTSSLRTNDWSFDGKFIATAGLDKTIILWNPTNGAKIRTINTGHTSTIVDVAISPNNQYIASLSQDKTLKLWRASNGTQVWSKTITSVFSRARMSFRWDSLQLALGNDKALEIRTTSTGNVARTLTGHTNTVGFVSWTPDGRHIISVGFDNQIRVWRCQ
jgi:WD40 repeat protein